MTYDCSQIYQNLIASLDLFHWIYPKPFIKKLLVLDRSLFEK